MKTLHDWNDIDSAFAGIRAHLDDPKAAPADLPPATFTSELREKKFYVPTGKFRTGKRSGKVTEEKIPMILQTATVTILRDTGHAFPMAEVTYRATNRGQTIRDYRGRHSPAAVRADLARILGEAMAESAMTDLLLVLPDASAPRKPRPPKVFPRDESFRGSDRTTEQHLDGTAAVTSADLLTDEVWNCIAHEPSAIERFEARIEAERLARLAA